VTKLGSMSIWAGDPESTKYYPRTCIEVALVPSTLSPEGLTPNLDLGIKLRPLFNCVTEFLDLSQQPMNERCLHCFVVAFSYVEGAGTCVRLE
jgi:hypothetical protein